MGSYKLYSDGGCKKPGGPGGWGVVIESPAGTIVELSGFEPETTNNRMELMGALKAVEAIPPGTKAELISDSKYIVRGMSEWIDGWIKREWRRAGNGKPVINQDLWKRLHALASKRDMTWGWVKGHTGHNQNERCDELANEEMDRNIKKDMKEAE